jgi:hypothetical protein
VGKHFFEIRHKAYFQDPVSPFATLLLNENFWVLDFQELRPVAGDLS